MSSFITGMVAGACLWALAIQFARRKPRAAEDGVPIRDGLTYSEDRGRVLDMLCLCGELGGMRPMESYSSYLRRLIDAFVENATARGASAGPPAEKQT